MTVGEAGGRPETALWASRSGLVEGMDGAPTAVVATLNVGSGMYVFWRK